jgi:hypothetical protein
LRQQKRSDAITLFTAERSTSAAPTARPIATPASWRTFLERGRRRLVATAAAAIPAITRAISPGV